MADVKANDLPEDIITDILLRLPVKSLMRFRSVCKSWRSLFRDPDFIVRHHRCQSLNSNSKVIVRHNIALGELCLSVLCSGGDEVVTVVDTIFPPFIDCFSETPSVIGPVNGLLLLYDMDLIILYNPATREFKTIPSPVIPTTLPGSVGSRPTKVGFGFDKKTNDYKILRFFHNLFGEPARDQVVLYSLKTNSWRELPCIDVSAVFPLINPYMNGAFHWWALTKGSPLRSLVLTFDFADEVFLEMMLPFDNSSIKFDLSQLAIMNALPSLVKLDYHETNAETWVRVWTIIKHGGVDDSWKKIEDIGPIRGYLLPLRFWKNYLFCDHGRELVLYDCSNKQVYNLQLYGNTLDVLSYVESLVPINGMSG